MNNTIVLAGNDVGFFYRNDVDGLYTDNSTLTGTKSFMIGEGASLQITHGHGYVLVTKGKISIGRRHPKWNVVNFTDGDYEAVRKDDVITEEA